MNNIGKDAMYYLTDRIRAISGVINAIATKRVDITGRFYAIVNKENIRIVRDKLTRRFDHQWYPEIVPEDARPRPDHSMDPWVLASQGLTVSWRERTH
jgi:hypothetical protein